MYDVQYEIQKSLGYFFYQGQYEQRSLQQFIGETSDYKLLLNRIQLLFYISNNKNTKSKFSIRFTIQDHLHNNVKLELSYFMRDVAPAHYVRIDFGGWLNNNFLEKQVGRGG